MELTSGKESFFTELSYVCQKQEYPLLVGGDFNIIRRASEKNKSGGCSRWSFLFNAVIESCGLKELELSGRKFTWANKLEDPTYEKLDRV